ncbi:hypothetical protein KP509_02G114300 [Ceratopteris richardii]|uniref:Uncharacterized protein n=1 Tax=Ceratopteris richardii TaxID=49495 RepID=A0A8T2VHY1_CERRI|nr:hypothetical protein KP509_02G114300 [Ceratopteris richardii]
MSDALLASSIASPTLMPMSAFFRFSILEALAPRRTTTSLSKPCEKHSTKFLSIVSLLNVSVPVLSLQRKSMPVSSSMAVMRLVNSPCSKRRWDPMAMVTKRIVGIAVGIPLIRSTKRLLIPSIYALCCIAYMTVISTTMPIAIE